MIGGTSTRVSVGAILTPATPSTPFARIESEMVAVEGVLRRVSTLVDTLLGAVPMASGAAELPPPANGVLDRVENTATALGVVRRQAVEQLDRLERVLS